MYTIKLNNILNRILIIIVFGVTLLPVIVMAFMTLVVMLIIGLFIYIFRGDENDKLMDSVHAPVFWVMDIPWRITGCIKNK